MTKKIFIISGPSGVGKSTIIKKILEKYKDKFEMSISCTTRAKREGETNGIQYYFVDKEKFQKMIKDNEFIEHKEVHDNNYGTLKSEIDRIIISEKIPLLDIDVQGVSELMKNNNKDYEFVKIFLFTELGVMQTRLKSRNDCKDNDIEKRLKNANKEIISASNLYDYYIKNDELKETLEKVYKIIDSNDFKVENDQFNKEDYEKLSEELKKTSDKTPQEELKKKINITGIMSEQRYIGAYGECSIL